MSSPMSWSINVPILQTRKLRCRRVRVGSPVPDTPSGADRQWSHHSVTQRSRSVPAIPSPHVCACSCALLTVTDCCLCCFCKFQVLRTLEELCEACGCAWCRGGHRSRCARSSARPRLGSRPKDDCLSLQKSGKPPSEVSRIFRISPPPPLGSPLVSRALSVLKG